MKKRIICGESIVEVINHSRDVLLKHFILSVLINADLILADYYTIVYNLVDSSAKVSIANANGIDINA